MSLFLSTCHFLPSWFIQMWNLSAVFFLVSASVVWSVAHDPVFLGKSSRHHYICLLQKVTTSAMSLLSQVIVTQHGDVRAHHKRNGTLFCNLIHCIKGATLPLIPFTLSKGNLRWQICFGLEKTQKNKSTICFGNSKKKNKLSDKLWSIIKEERREREWERWRRRCDGFSSFFPIIILNSFLHSSPTFESTLAPFSTHMMHCPLLFPSLARDSSRKW